MEKLKSIIFVAGIMLLVLAAAVGYLSIKYLTAILPADSYEDKGVYTFSPYQVLPVQVQNTGASGRYRRMKPTKTAYMVYYQDTGGSGGCWRSPLMAPISPWSRTRPQKATPQDFGKSTLPPLYWRGVMSCCM